MSGVYNTRQKDNDKKHAQLMQALDKLVDAQVKTTEAIALVRKELARGNAHAESIDETLLDLYELKEQKRAKLEESANPIWKVYSKNFNLRQADTA